MKKIELNDVSVSYIVGDFSNLGLKDVIIQKLKGTYTAKEFTAVKQPDNSLKVTMKTLYLVPKVFIDINGNPCIDEESG